MKVTASPPSSSGIVQSISITTTKHFGNDTLAIAILSGVAGYVDTAGCLTLFGLLTAHVTGALVTAGALMAEHPKLGALARLAMLPIFMLTVAATALFVRRRKRLGTTTLVPLLALMTSALALFCATGVALHRFAGAPDAWAVGLIGGTGVIAMAIQNTLMRGVLSGYCPTTIMTGNLTQVTIDLVELLLPLPESDPNVHARSRAEAIGRLVKFGVPLAGFMVGATLGAVLTHALGLLSIAVPTIATASLTVIAARADHRARIARTGEAVLPSVIPAGSTVHLRIPPRLLEVAEPVSVGAPPQPPSHPLDSEIRLKVAHPADRRVARS